jgi:RimJ/RimL family protein N-acetyltransferase
MARFVRHWEERGFGLWTVKHEASGAFIGFIGLLHQNDWPEGAHKIVRWGGGSTAPTGAGGSLPRVLWRACSTVSRS